MVVSNTQSRLPSLLQPTESLISSLDDVQDASSPSVTDGRARPAWLKAKDAKRSLAIVVRQGKESGNEIAAVLIWQDSPTGPVVIGMSPILQDFQVSIEQTDKHSSNGSTTPKTKFVVSLAAPSSPPSPPSRQPFTTSFSFVCDTLSSSTTDFIAHLKRLHEIAESNDFTSSSKTHDWCKTYLPGSPTPPSGEEGQSRRTGRFDQHFESVSNAYSRRKPLRSTITPHASTLSPSTPLDRSVSSSPKSSRNQRLDSPDERASSGYSKEAHESIERWMVDRMKGREGEFMNKEEIRVWCGTFNVNDKLPRPDGSDLKSWIQGGLGAELIVLGFQELDLTTEAMIRYTPYREEAWREALEADMGDKKGEYELLHSKQLVGVLTIVYVKKSVRKDVSNVSSASLATGFLGLMANKGVVGIRLRYKDTPITFLNSHLAAFTSQTQQRNAQFRDIISQLLFPFVEGEARDPWTPNLHLLETAERPAGEGWSVGETGILVWLGDLNYRIELPRKEVTRMISQKDYETLLRFDQLKIQQQHHLAFTEFEEAPLTFPPTYKFDRGSDVYDSSEKQRTPSWTDRILWLSMKEREVSAENYTTHLDCSFSDHKPVSTILCLPVSTVDEAKRNVVQQEVIAELNEFDNDSLPDVKILPGPSVEFGEIEFDTPVTKTIEISNVGQTLAPWSFVLKPSSSSLLPPWLTISPTSGLVVPGEKSTITLTIHVTSSCSSSLNFPLPSDEGLSDLFILSIEKKDLFLSVSAREYRPSVFGSSLEHLSRLRQPIRTASIEERQRIASVVEISKKSVLERSEEEKKELEGAGKVGVPRALHQLVSFLAENALEMEDLFLAEGKAELVDLVREALDTGADLPLDRLHLAPTSSSKKCKETDEKQHLREAVAALDRLESDIGSLSMEGTATPPIQGRPKLTPKEDEERNTGLHSIAACLLSFLQNLAEPVIPFSFYSKAIRCEKREEAYGLVQDLPEVHANVLLYLLAFLRVLLKQTQDPKARAHRMDSIAIAFSVVLLRQPANSLLASLSAGVDVSTIPRRKKQFVYFLLEEK